MKNIKSIGLIAVAAVSFVFMSFSSSSEELYGDSYVVKQESFKSQKNQNGIITVVVSRAVVYVTRNLVLSASQITTSAFTHTQGGEITVVAFANNIDKHTSKYNKEIKKIKRIKINSLG